MRKAAGLILVLAAAAAGTAFGGDTSRYRFLGFSPDLRSCGFEVYGVMDGSGFPYSTVYLIDVAKNDYAVKPSAAVGEDGESEEQVRSAVMEAAALKLRAFGIQETNTGDFTPADPANSLKLAVEAGGRRCTLRLVERPTGNETDIGEPEKMFELDLAAGGKSVVLQKDASLPGGRKGAYRYGIVGAYVNADRVAVFLQWEKAGFEGPDVRQMIVTGVVPR